METKTLVLAARTWNSLSDNVKHETLLKIFKGYI